MPTIEKNDVNSMRGCFYFIGSTHTLSNVDVVVICKDYLTAKSVFNSTKYPTLVAYNDDSLMHIATKIAKKFSEISIIIIDVQNKNAGVTKAQVIAEMVRGHVIKQTLHEEIELKVQDIRSQKTAQRMLAETFLKSSSLS